MITRPQQTFRQALRTLSMLIILSVGTKIRQIILSKGSVYIYLLLGLLVITVLIQATPIHQPIPSRDSGVFLYLGQQILDGKLPYRDVWDHKGPGIHYINALGLFLGQGSRWGVWFLEVLSLSTAVLLGYIVMRQALGSGPAVFASILWLISLTLVLQGGNYAEEFTLPIQFAALYVFWRSKNSGLQVRYLFLMGVTLAGSFLLKPNGTGLPLCIILLFFWEILSLRRHNMVVHMMALFFGIVTVILPVVIYFVWTNTFSEFIDSVFRYNFIYTTSTSQNKIDSMFEGLQLLTRSGITITTLTAWIIGCFSLYDRTRYQDKQMPLLYLALIGLPIELFLSGASGRTYSHYYMAWLPIFALLTGLFAFSFLTNFSSPDINFLKQKIEFKFVWILALLIAMFFPSLKEVISPVISLIRSNKPETSSIVERITSYTGKDDYLLMWGAEASFNFLTNRPSPSPFVYQYPLYTCGYATEEMIAEFLDDITENKPLIVDTSSTNRVIPPLDNNNRKIWSNVVFAGSKTNTCELSPKMGDLFELINSHYSVVEVIEPNHWAIYKYVEDK